ncbi:MAG: hypothetical protein EH225_02180 [Calditrichaeota bacterium]|nr:family 10 glycosylhydrolase [Calditrichota bacterium]RQW07289.1 MAG: hypothetical protein EH225_02180 [Calditrichota bacterium]
MLCSREGKDFPKLTELRGVWLTNVDSRVLDSRESISEAMQFLAEHHFNIVFPVVWNDAKTLYPSQVMEELFGFPIDPRFAGRDPLQEVIEEAHSRDIAVIPWFEYGFAASFQKNGGMILQKKPEWSARDINGGLLTKNGFEWMNGYHPEVQNFLLSLILEVVRNYDVQGIQGDDRLPAQPVEGGYSSYTIDRYMKEQNEKYPPAYEQDSDWMLWRADILNEFAGKVYREVKKIKPDMYVSWAPSIYPWSYDEYLQDWPAWVLQGNGDIIHPQVYRYSIQEYRSSLDSIPGKTLLGRSPDSLIYPGVLMNVGDYVISPEFLLQAVAYNREKGYRGEVFFFYEGLRKNGDQLADSLKATWYREPARLPFEWKR